MKQGKFKRTIKLSKLNNIATFWLVPSFREFDAYETMAGITSATDIDPIISGEVYIIEDEELPYCKPLNT